jgi:hypothetical protein
MKKIFTLLFFLGLISTAFAQRGGRNDCYSDSRYSSQSHAGYSNYYNNGADYNNGPDGQYGRTQDRYDERNAYGNSDYGYNRIPSRERSGYYERNRRETYRHEERSGQLKALGAGLIVGGVLALIAGSH